MRVVIVATFLEGALSLSMCCWSRWGDASSCGGYSGSGGLCNTDLTMQCSSDGNCPAPTLSGPSSLLLTTTTTTNSTCSTDEEISADSWQCYFTKPSVFLGAVCILWLSCLCRCCVSARDADAGFTKIGDDVKSQFPNCEEFVDDGMGTCLPLFRDCLKQLGIPKLVYILSINVVFLWLTYRFKVNAIGLIITYAIIESFVKVILMAWEDREPWKIHYTRGKLWEKKLRLPVAMYMPSNVYLDLTTSLGSIFVRFAAQVLLSVYLVIYVRDQISKNLGLKLLTQLGTASGVYDAEGRISTGRFLREYQQLVFWLSAAVIQMLVSAYVGTSFYSEVHIWRKLLRPAGSAWFVTCPDLKDPLHVPSNQLEAPRVRCNTVLRMIMSFLANGLGIALITYLIPLVLVNADDLLEFVQDSFAVTFIPAIDNLPLEKVIVLFRTLVAEDCFVESKVPVDRGQVLLQELKNLSRDPDALSFNNYPDFINSDDKRRDRDMESVGWDTDSEISADPEIAAFISRDDAETDTEQRRF